MVETLNAGTAAGPDESCAFCDGHPTVLVGIRHRPMRRLTRQVLEHDCPTCVVVELGDHELLLDAVPRLRPDVLVVDTGDFPACCHPTLAAFPPQRVVVVGPEPEAAYRLAALSDGAGAWVARERIAEDLRAELRRLFGCPHVPAGRQARGLPARVRAGGVGAAGPAG